MPTTIVTREIISLNSYQSIHCWLRYHYGKAYKCENKDCKKKCIKFEWALKKDYKYEKKRENYIQLCKSCHWKYDVRPETLIKYRLSNSEAKKTHCPQKHPYSIENTQVVKTKHGVGRACKTCNRNRVKVFWRKKYGSEYIKSLPF